eukprot:scpid90854/ scgid32201/ 
MSGAACPKSLASQEIYPNGMLDSDLQPAQSESAEHYQNCGTYPRDQGSSSRRPWPTQHTNSHGSSQSTCCTHSMASIHQRAVTCHQSARVVLVEIDHNCAVHTVPMHTVTMARKLIRKLIRRAPQAGDVCAMAPASTGRNELRHQQGNAGTVIRLGLKYSRNFAKLSMLSKSLTEGTTAERIMTRLDS